MDQRELKLSYPVKDYVHARIPVTVSRDAKRTNHEHVLWRQLGISLLMSSGYSLLCPEYTPSQYIFTPVVTETVHILLTLKSLSGVTSMALHLPTNTIA